MTTAPHTAQAGLPPYELQYRREVLDRRHRPFWPTAQTFEVNVLANGSEP
jgi:hypothetical protein